MPITTARQLILLGVAATAPIALGIAMHLEHLEAERACIAQTPIAAEVITHVLPMPTPFIVAQAEADDMRGAYDFAFVIDVPTPHIVLAGTADLNDLAMAELAVNAPHYRGAPADAFSDQPVWRDIDLARLPERARLAIGRHVRVYSVAGRVCIARIGMPSVVSEASGAIESMEDDEMTEIEDGEQTVIDPASLWSRGRISLVAPLEGEDCKGGAWARDVALPEPLVYVAQDLETAGDLPSPVARRMVQRSTALRPIVTAFAEHVASFDDEAFTTRRFIDRLEGRRWIEPTKGGELDVFSADGEEFGGCGGFDPAWAAIAVDTEGTPGDPVWVDAQTDYVHAVFDLEADGKPEVLAQTWLGATRVFSLDGEDLREIATLTEVQYFGCPC